MLLVEVREQNVISYIDAFRHRLINQDIPIILQQDKFDHEGQRVPYSPTDTISKIATTVQGWRQFRLLDHERLSRTNPTAAVCIKCARLIDYPEKGCQ